MCECVYVSRGLCVYKLSFLQNSLMVCHLVVKGTMALRLELITIRSWLNPVVHDAFKISYFKTFTSKAKSIQTCSDIHSNT